VLAWLSNRRDSPFFVFVNYFDAHEPYLPPSPFDRQFGPGRSRGRYSPLHRWLWEPGVAHRDMPPDVVNEEMNAYDGSIAYLDHQIGLLLDQLASRNLLDHTLVVITADHGEEFGEHGLYDHGYTLYRTALQVPLVIVARDRVPEATRVAAPISLRDVPATIVNAIGLGPGAPFPGQSLASFWGSPAETRRNTEDGVVSEVGRANGQPSWFPASKGDMKAVLFRGVSFISNGDKSEELYDLERDPGEHHNLAALPEHRARVAEYRRTLERMLAR